ncbi:hypothetical protein BH23ACT10_BH23ACT10_32240 [soil metagenome]
MTIPASASPAYASRHHARGPAATVGTPTPARPHAPHRVAARPQRCRHRAHRQTPAAALPGPTGHPARDAAPARPSDPADRTRASRRTATARRRAASRCRAPRPCAGCRSAHIGAVTPANRHVQQVVARERCRVQQCDRGVSIGEVEPVKRPRAIVVGTTPPRCTRYDLSVTQRDPCPLRQVPTVMGYVPLAECRATDEPRVRQRLEQPRLAIVQWSNDVRAHRPTSPNATERRRRRHRRRQTYRQPPATSASRGGGGRGHSRSPGDRRRWASRARSSAAAAP